MTCICLRISLLTAYILAPVFNDFNKSFLTLIYNFLYIALFLSDFINANYIFAFTNCSYRNKLFCSDNVIAKVCFCHLQYL